MHILLSTFPLSFFFFDFSRGKISIFKREWKRGKPFFSHNFWMPKNRFVSIMLTTGFFIVVKSILEISKLDKKKMSNFEKTKIVFQKKCIFLFVSGMLRKFFTEKNFVTEEKKKNTNSG